MQSANFTIEGTYSMIHVNDVIWYCMIDTHLLLFELVFGGVWYTQGGVDADVFIINFQQCVYDIWTGLVE